MNEILIKVSPEQFAIMQKLLEPYVLLSASLNAQYRASIQTPPVMAQKLDPQKKEDLEEIITRG